MADDELLMGSWRYAPLIHWMDRNSLHHRGLDAAAPPNCYELVAIHDGQAWLWRAGHREPLRLPAVVIQTPGRGPALIAPRASTFHRLSFDVVRVPCVRINGRALRHARPAPQPPPRAVWGVDLPELVPAALVDACQAMLAYCDVRWWQGDLEAMQANLRLGQWIADLVAHLGVGPAAPDGTWITAAATELRQGLHRRTRVTQVAQLLGMSRGHFATRFKAETGRTPSAFLHDLRMEEAARLLRATDLGVTPIARLCGARSSTTFSAAFRRHFGLPPICWRMRQRG